MNSGGDRALSRNQRRAARFRSHLLGRTALCGALTLGIAAGAGLAPRDAKAGPQGTVVVGGAVDIAKSGTHTEFTQHTQTAILNHDSFDIRVNESVNFAQPNSGALAVNRIIGSDLPTSIAGKLTANGNVWVLNPSGVAVHGTAQVNVGGLLATTASISDEAIMAGRHGFAGAPEGSAVTNAGSIAAGEGSVVLVAPVVENTGTITASGSDVALGAGSGFTVDFAGDGLTRFQVTPGNGVSLSNTGAISAQGGAAYLSAASAGAVQSSVVSIGGRVEATRIEERGGVIVISGGDQGVTRVTGEIDASQATGDGGRVIVTGDLVDIGATARIDASGAIDGGTVEIGGAFQGGAIASDVVASAGAPRTAPLPTARRTVVRDGARIAADAGVQGDGGEVVVWADEATGFSGAISARGGAEGGDGGFAEVSGKQKLAFDGQVDLSAPSGETGTLLLDPEDITIADDGDDEVTSDNEILFDDGTPTEDFVISNEALERTVASILLQASQDITVSTDVSASADLTFEAGRDIIIENNDQLATTGNLVLSADAAFSGQPSNGDGTLIFGNNNSSISGAFVHLRTGEAVTLGNVTAADSLLVETTNFGTGGDIAQSQSLTVTGDTKLDAGTGNITLGNDANSFSAGISATGTNILLDDSSPVILVDIDAAGTLDVESGGDIVDSGTTTAGGGVNVAGTTTLRTGSGDEIILDDDVNDFGGAVTVVGSPDAVTISDANTLVAGAMSAGDAITLGAADTVDITDTLSAPEITIRNTSGGGIGLGATAVDGFQVTDTELELVAGDAIFDADGSIVVDGASVAIASRDITLDGGGGVAFETTASSFAGALTIEAGGAVTQTAALTVDGATDIVTSGDAVTLANAGNDFGSAVGVDTGSGATVALADSDGITLGAIAASTLSVTAGGSITDTDEASISVTGATTMTAQSGGNFFDIALDNDSADGDAPHALSEVQDNVFTGEDITVRAGSLRLGAVTAHDDGEADPTIPGGDGDVLVAGDGLLVLAGALVAPGDFTASGLGIADFPGGSVSVGGETSLTGAGSVVLNSAANDFRGVVDASAGTFLELVDANDITLRDIQAGVALSVTATDIDTATGAQVLVGTDLGGGDFDGAITITNLDPSAGAVIGGAVADGDPSTMDILESDIGAWSFGSLTFRNFNATAAASVNLDAIDVTDDGDPNKSIFVEGLGLDVLGAVDLGAGTLGFKNAGPGGTALFPASVGFGFGAIDDTSLANITAGTLLVDSNGQNLNFGGFVANVDTLVADAADDALSAWGDVTFDEGALSVSNLTVTGADVITQTGLGAIVVPGEARFEALGDVTLNLAANDVSGTLEADIGGDFRFANAGALALGAMTIAGDLSVAAGGAITDTDGEKIEVTGTTSLSAGDGLGFFDIVLDNGDRVAGDIHDFGGAVSAEGQDIAITDMNALILGAVTTHAGGDDTINAPDNDGDLTVRSGGTLSNALAVAVAGDLDATAQSFADPSDFFDISIDGAALGGSMSLSGEDIFVHETSGSAVEIGTVTARADSNADGTLISLDGGSFGLRSNGATDGSGGAISVEERLVIDGAGDFIFDNENAHSVPKLHAYGGGALGIADDVTLNTETALLLDFHFSTFTITGDLTVSAEGAITQAAGGITVAGLTATAANDAGTEFFDIRLDDSANAINGAISASGEDISITNASVLGTNLAAVTAHDESGGVVDPTTGSGKGDLTIVSTGGPIIDDAAGAITVPGTTSLFAGTGATFFDIALDDAGHDLGNDAGDAFIAIGEDITVVNVDGIVLGNITAHDDALTPGKEGALIVRSGGDVVQMDGTSVVAPGSSEIVSAGAITLTEGGNDFADEDSDTTLALDAMGNIVITDADSVALGAVGGANLLVTSDDVSLGGTVSVTSAGFTSRSGDQMVLGALSADASGATFEITDDDLLRINAAEVSLTTAGNGGAGIDVQGAALDTDRLTLDAGAGSVDFTTGATTVSGRMMVTAEGDIRQTAAGTVAVAGRTTLSAGGAIALGNAANNFDSDAGATAVATEEVDAAGTEIALGDADAIALGAIVAESLTVNAGGSITDTAGKSITVTGATDMTALRGGDAFDIRLDGDDGDPADRPHDFSASAGFSARGEDILVFDANAIRFGTVETGDAASGTADPTIGGGNAGDLTVNASGAITQSGAMLVRGDAVFTAPGDIVLNAGNDFRGSVDATGDTVRLTDGSAIALGTITADRLTVTAGGTISDTAGRVIEVAGDTSLTAGGEAGGFHDIRLTSQAHDFADAAGAEFSAVGEDLSVRDADAINLGSVTLHAGDGGADGAIAGNAGTALVVAGGDITQTGIVRAPGESRFDASGDVRLGLANHFGSSVDAEGGVVTLADADALRLGRIRSAGDLTVSAGGSITDTDGRSIEVGGSTSLAAAAGGEFFDILLDNENAGAGDVHDLGSHVDATGEDIRLTDIGALMLGTVTPHDDATPDLTLDAGNNGDLTVRAGGTVTQQVSLTIPGELDVTALDFGAGDYFDVLLALENSIGGIISASAEDVSLRNTGGQTTLGAITTHGAPGETVDTAIGGSDGDLTVVSTGGSIGDAAGMAIAVAGETRLRAGGGGDFFGIALDNANMHDLTGPVSAAGEDIVLDDRNAIVLGAIDAKDGGDLTVRAGGSITDTAAAIEVEGRTRLEARNAGNYFDIALDSPDIHDFAGEVSATGEDIVLDDRNAIVLGAIDANESGEDAGAAAADETVAWFDDNGDGLGSAADGTASAGDLTVRAGGAITETGAGIDVEGRTRLEARDGATAFDVTLGTGAHDFDSNSLDPDARQEVDIDGANVALADTSAVKLGQVSATGDLSVTAAGSVTDTDGEAVIANGQTTIRAVGAGGTDFFDIAFDNPDGHDFNVVELSGEGILLVDRNDLTIASAEARGDAATDATVPGSGSIDLTVADGDFRFAAGNPVPLEADGDITLSARQGSFAVGGERRTLQDGLTFRSHSGDIRLELANGFVVPDIAGTGPFVLDAASGNSTLVIGNHGGTEFFGIGTERFLEDAQSPGFNPLVVTAPIGDAELFHVTGDLTMIAAHPITVRIQNTSIAANRGGGTVVAGQTFLGGEFAGLTLFGSFNGSDGTTASLQGFQDLGDFVLENGNTVNGCVILVASSCQPIGSLSLALDFPDGLLLGVKFLDPAEDLDDPFTNRGDEEEWE